MPKGNFFDTTDRFVSMLITFKSTVNVWSTGASGIKPSQVVLQIFSFTGKVRTYFGPQYLIITTTKIATKLQANCTVVNQQIFTKGLKCDYIASPRASMNLAARRFRIK